MTKHTSTAQRIRVMIDRGHHNKAIIEKLQCKPQAVYNIRYQINKARGLGSIGKVSAPTTGIGIPPKRTRKVRGGELASLPEMNPAQNVYPQTGEWEDRHLPITMIEPTLWQRIVRFFKGN